MDVSASGMQRSCLCANRHWLSETFKDTAHFLSDAEAHSKDEVGEEMNFMYQGIQLTRYFRALKFWMSLKVFGLGCRAALRLNAALNWRKWRNRCLRRCRKLGDRHASANGDCDLPLQTG